MSGVDEEDYANIKVERLDDLELVYLGEYKQVIKIWTLPGLTEASWEYYDTHEITGLKEQKLLYEALNNLNKAIRKIL